MDQEMESPDGLRRIAFAMWPVLKNRLDYNAIAEVLAKVPPRPLITRIREDVCELARLAFITVRHWIGKVIFPGTYSGESLHDVLGWMSECMHDDYGRQSEDEDYQIDITTTKTHFWFSYWKRNSMLERMRIVGGPWKVSKRHVFDEYFDQWRIVDRRDEQAISALKACVISYHSAD